MRGQEYRAKAPTDNVLLLEENGFDIVGVTSSILVTPTISFSFFSSSLAERPTGAQLPIKHRFGHYFAHSCALEKTMTEALPIAFVTFKRCVHETLAGTPLAFQVERAGPDWQVVFTSPDGNNMMGVPPNKGMMTSEAAARGFAKAALELALEGLTGDPPKEHDDA